MKIMLYLVEISMVLFLEQMKYILEIIVKEKVEYILILIIIIFRLLINKLIYKLYLYKYSYKNVNLSNK